jgi:serine/threonine protein kinase
MSGDRPANDLPDPDGERDPLLGRVLDGRYQVVEQIGRGGMGRVYRALQVPLNRQVALKTLGAGFGSDPDFSKRFYLEAWVTAKLTHPNTIRIYEYGSTSDGIFFIAMELLDGRSLSQVLQQEGALAQARVVHLAQQICRSLREAHALGIIHRDLKPANVMLLRQQDEFEFVKVLDFGLVTFFGQGNPDLHLTNQGTFIGSPHYIAPEQARNQGPDQRCDIYSLGVLLYEMLTGQVPFTARAPVDVIVKHVLEAPVPPRELRPDLDISPELQEVVLTCLAKQREDRYQTMGALLARLQIVSRHLTGLAAPPPRPRKPAPARQARLTPRPERSTPRQPMVELPAKTVSQAERPAATPPGTGWIAKRRGPSLTTLILPALPGAPATPVTQEWLTALRTLHERAQQGGLDAPEQARYDRERALLAFALREMQAAAMKPGHSARRSLRLATDLLVALALDQRPERTKTLDLSLGGFAVLLDRPLRVGQRVGFSIQLHTGPLSGRAQVVNLQGKGGIFRVGFGFEELTPVDASRVNFEVFDGALSGLSAAQATPG